MGFFSGSSKPAKGRTGNNQSKGQVCPRHGRYNSLICDSGCRSQISGATGQRVGDKISGDDGDVVDPSNGFW